MRRDTLGWITSANCSPTASSRNSFHVCSLLSLGTRNVHAPPRTLRGSSQMGLTPRLKKCTASFIFKASSGKPLYASQKDLSVMMFSSRIVCRFS